MCQIGLAHVQLTSSLLHWFLHYDWAADITELLEEWKALLEAQNRIFTQEIEQVIDVSQRKHVVSLDAPLP